MDLTLQEVPTTSRGAATAQDLVDMFAEDPLTRGQGRIVSGKIIAMALDIIESYLQSNRSGVGAVSSSLCESFFLPNQSETIRARLVEQHLLCDQKEQEDLKPASYYIDRLVRSFSRLLLCHQVAPNYYVVFEVVWRSERGRLLKVWDGVGAWTNQRTPKEIPEVKLLLDVLFEGDEIPVFLSELGEAPCGTRASGPFSFMTMSSLVMGVRLKGWRATDEGVARNYTWGCLMKGRLLSPPLQKLGV